MSAGSKSPANEALWAGPMEFVTRLTLRFPYVTLGVALALALVSLGFTAARLGYRTSRMDLLHPDREYNRLWKAYTEEFGAEDDAVVVVEGAGREQVIAAIEDLAAGLSREDDSFHAVLHKVDLSKIQAKGLHYLSTEELQQIERFVDRTGPIVAGNWSRLNLGQAAAGLGQRMTQPTAEQVASDTDVSEIERLAASLCCALSKNGSYRSPWPQPPDPLAGASGMSSQYLLANGGRLGFVLLRLAPGEDAFAKGSEAADALRGLISQVQERHPQVQIGLTGIPILENDEMRASSSSMLWASLISLAGVALLFVAGFGGIRHALLANLVLLVGMAWSFGYVTLAVGHLNILSVSFTVSLIGIGIDYGIHYVSRYLQLRRQGLPCHDALLATSRGIGPAIVTGAVTTAVAFYAAAFTSFTGIAELGMIAGGGILLCAAAELVVLPASIYLVDQTAWGARLPEPLPVHRWIEPLMRRSRLVLAVTVAGAVVVALGIDRLWYDHNLLNMQASDLESVRLEQKLLAECNQSSWYALSIADSREALLERKARLLELDSVERTEEIVSLLPVDSLEKQPIVARIQRRLEKLPEAPPQILVNRPEELDTALAELQRLLAGDPQGAACLRQLEQARAALRQLPAADCYALISRYQQQMAGDLLARLRALREVADARPPELSDLPESLVQRFVGKHDRHLLKIYGRGNIWDMQALTHFVTQVRSVDPRATGHPLQAYEASLEMKQSYETAALYALVIIVAVLMFDFQNLRDALLAAAPLGVGLLQMFGLLGWLNIPLNAANMIALPLILGIGVDYGVHIVHEFRESSGRYRISASTAVAVLVDSLTTIVGFGSLMIASHQGLASLGRVLTLGVSCCLFTSLVMLPALLTWLTKNRPRVVDAAAEPPAMPTLEATESQLYRRIDDEHDPHPTPHVAPARRLGIHSNSGATRRESSNP